MDTCILLWYRTTAHGSIRNLARTFETEWEAERWIVSRPRRTKPGRGGTLWVEIEVQPGVWASVGRARSESDIPRVLAKPSGFRFELRDRSAA